MEQQQLEYLKTWKQELEKENQEFLSDLRKYNKERDELLTKRSFLTELNIQPINGDSIDDVNLFSGYDEFDGRLRDLQSNEQHEFEKKLESKIDYNKIIIRRINLYLP